MSLRAIATSFTAVNYQGTWDASSNTPTLTSSVGVNGSYYIVSVAGNTNLNGITNWGVGDWVVFNGSVWERLEGGPDGNFVNLTVSGTTTLSGVSALSVATTADTTPSSSLGAFSYGTLTYADVNNLATFQTTVNNYAQVEIQNSNAGAASSADMVVGNNNTTASTYYGDFGMNSSGWVGTAPFNTPNNVYLTSTTADLAIGTTTANAIRFATNSAEVARMFSSGGVSIGNSTDPGATNLSVTGSLTLKGNVSLYGDAANAIAQRNGANPQTQYIYNGYTDASNYSRLTITSDNTKYNIVGEQAGTGSYTQGLSIIAGFYGGVTISGYQDTLVRSTAYGVYIFTGAGNNGWYFNASRTILPTTDNAYDLGTQANRVRTIYSSGGFSAGIVTKTTTYTATVNDRTILGDATATGFTITLPDATTNTGRIYTLKKIDSSVNIVTIGTTSSQTIDGAATQTLVTQWSKLSVQSNGTAWFTI